MAKADRPRRMAAGARSGIVLASGVSLGLLTGHLVAEATASQVAAASSSEDAPAVQQTPEPVIVTIVETEHVPSEPVIVYRRVPAGSSGGGSGSGGNWSSGGSSSARQAPAPAPQRQIQPAPAPQPAPAQPPQGSSRSS